MGRVPAIEARARRMARNVQQQEVPRKSRSALHTVRSLARKDQPRFERGHSQSDRADESRQAGRESSSRISSAREGTVLSRPRDKIFEGESNMATRAVLNRK